MYCGVLWCQVTQKELYSSVAIRTVEYDDGKLSLGVGSGIVEASDPASEYDETIEKAKLFL